MARPLTVFLLVGGCQGEGSAWPTSDLIRGLLTKCGNHGNLAPSIFSLTHTQRRERSKVMTTVRPSKYIIDHIDTHWWGFRLVNSHLLNLTVMWDKEYQDFIITLTTHFQDVVLWCFGYNTILCLGNLVYKVESGEGNPGENYEFLMKSAVVGQSKVGTPKKRNHFFRDTIYFVTSPPSKIKVDCQSRMAS